MTDSHCHLVDEKYYPKETDQIVQNAVNVGVEKLISAGAGFEHSKQTVLLAEKYESVYATVGMGYEPDERYRLNNLRDLLKSKKVVAIGECGLDFLPETTDELKKKQVELFTEHIALAKEMKLPLIVHCRNAFETVFELVKDTGVLGQLHCFTGHEQWMRRFVDLGWYISFGGIVTFKKSEELREVLKQTPQERILIETDSPYLSPEPLRSERNEPANLKIIAEQVANVRSETFESVASYTSQNAVRLFQI